MLSVRAATKPSSGECMPYCYSRGHELCVTHFHYSEQLKVRTAAVKKCFAHDEFQLKGAGGVSYNFLHYSGTVALTEGNA